MSDEQWLQGRILGALLRDLRGELTSEALAQRAGVRVDTLRKIEAGGVAAPGFFIVGQIVEAAGGELNALWRDTRPGLGAQQ